MASASAASAGASQHLRSLGPCHHSVGSPPLGALLHGRSVLLARPRFTAQGVTTAAMRGTITREEGNAPIEGAVVTLINVPEGHQASRGDQQQRPLLVRERRVRVAPIRSRSRAIGFELTTKSGVILTLGQRYIQDFVLKAQVVTLQELEVIATTDPLINAGRTGPSTSVSDTAIRGCRSWAGTGAACSQASPQVAVGNSIAGQNNRFNNVQIDGAVNNDVFGLPSEPAAGRPGGVKPLSIEAFKEFQVLVAPFDVRQGGFTGGLVNAVTKSRHQRLGRVGRSATSRTSDLVGKDTAGAQGHRVQAAAVRRHHRRPDHQGQAPLLRGGRPPEAGRPLRRSRRDRPETGITAATADRVTAALRSQYGFDPGHLRVAGHSSSPTQRLRAS